MTRQLTNCLRQLKNTDKCLVSPLKVIDSAIKNEKLCEQSFKPDQKESQIAKQIKDITTQTQLPFLKNYSLHWDTMPVLSGVVVDTDSPQFEFKEFEPKYQPTLDFNNYHANDIQSFNQGDVVWAEDMPSNPSESDP